MMQQKTDRTKPWEMSASAFQARLGVPQPFIGEISPMQYANLSNRGQRQYDEKRRREWGASAQAKSGWREKVIGAFQSGEISLETPGLHPEARGAILSYQIQQEKEERQERINRALNENRISSCDELSVGDRVYSNILGRYVEVTKVNKKSVRIKFRARRFGTGTLEDSEIREDPRLLQWRSSFDIHREVEGD